MLAFERIGAAPAGRVLRAKLATAAIALLAPFTPSALLAQASSPVTATAPDPCDITAFGARADDNVPDTVALQRALDECSSIGRRVHVPAGSFDIGHIRLPAGTDLYLAPNARLAASLDLADYPPLPAMNGETAWFYAQDASNIVISGAGLLDGQAGPIYRMVKEVVARDRTDPRANERVRFGLLFNQCSNVRLRDLRMRDPQMYFMNFMDCDDVIIDGVDLSAPADSHNTDGIQITDSRDVRISNCRIAVGDDAIVTKARARPIERLMVNNCLISSDDAAIKFGTRSSSGVRDSQFSNIVITDSRYGIALFMIHGGEYTGNRFSNIQIVSGGRHPRTYPIYVDIDDRVRNSREAPGSRPMGIIDGLVFSDIEIRSAGNILIAGHPRSPIRNLALSDVRFVTMEGESISPSDTKPRGNRRFAPVPGSPDLAAVDASMVLGYIDGLQLDNITIRGNSGRTDRYLESVAAFGDDAPPAATPMR